MQTKLRCHLTCTRGGGDRWFVYQFSFRVTIPRPSNRPQEMTTVNSWVCRAEYTSMFNGFNHIRQRMFTDDWSNKFSRWFGVAYRLLVQCTGKEGNSHDTKLFLYQDGRKRRRRERKKERKKDRKKRKGSNFKYNELRVAYIDLLQFPSLVN